MTDEELDLLLAEPDDGLTIEQDDARGVTTVRVDGVKLATLTEDD